MRSEHRRIFTASTELESGEQLELRVKEQWDATFGRWEVLDEEYYLDGECTLREDLPPEVNSDLLNMLEGRLVQLEEYCDDD